MTGKIQQRLDNEIRNTMNYYHGNLESSLKHHIKQCLRIQLGKSDVDTEYEKLVTENTK